MTTQVQRKFKVLLIGDHCLDTYQFGNVDRISPEAPVPVFQYESSRTIPGMAGNVKLNLEALGCDVIYMHGEGVGTKTRLIDQRSRQHLIRIDEDVVSHPLKFKDIPYNLKEVWESSNLDAIIISDYNKGYVSYELIEQLIKEFPGPVFVDTKKTDLKRLEGAYIKINELEYSRLTSQCSGIIVTMGANGARYNDVTVPAERVEVSDVCGAGDTFLAALTYRYIAHKEIIDAMEFAILASGITVQKLGNYAPTLEEIQ
jgi:D-beta-D-heptose 7-phosphate kinase/D-beta-D-heptose 1-phosphate adenosyltransferase